ncbi:MAG: hypothetical protein HUU06_03290, partial [Planctomycetaceae bacterium]|nr:hypothetical protein [Planctomycetaceae bacterium]
MIVRDHSTAPEERRWLLLRTFYSSWKRFRVLFEEYERRVDEFSQRYKTVRASLRLAPDDLSTLLDFKALEDLRDREVSLLREISHDLFRSPDATDRFDHCVSIIYHELSALKEEHYTLREEFVREQRIEYDHFYREVNEYYPKRLRHLRNLYTKADRRLRQLLPAMADDRVVVRSLYLFGRELLEGVLPGGVEEVYRSMYPGGEAEGCAAAGDSFRESGFLADAAEAYGRCLAVEEGPERVRRGRG